MDSTQAPPNTPQQSQRKIDANTREILEKIAIVNKQQGLVQKKAMPSYFHFPFSYSRSQEEPRSNNFKFSRNPFSNPVLDYLEKDPVPSFRKPNFENGEPPDFGVSVTDTNPEILPEDNIPGQYIKRKVTHYQSFMVPNPYALNMYNSVPTAGASYPMPAPNFNQQYGFSGQNVGLPTNPPSLGASVPNENLTQQALNNIKEVLLGSHVLQVPNYPSHDPNALKYPHPNYYQSQTPNAANKARQNWNWPGANLFPIYVRDPFLQMYYAVTNMIEYGPTAGNEGPCKLTPRPQGSRVKLNAKSGDVGQQVSLELNRREDSGELKIKENDQDASDPMRYLNLEDIDVGDDDLVKFTVNVPGSSAPGARDLNDPDTNSLTAKNMSEKLDLNVAAESKQTATVGEPTLQVEELEDEVLEAERAEEIAIANQGSKKVFSRDNTGNGIFIQKLKVRKGGVAIAGPGGIATAGSGGTAIVGPNGIAYTHPDGLAIAGSGTQVIAVDPKIDLNDVIKNSVLNGTRHVPNTRVGKVVAVGPVVYYNRG